MMFAKTAAQRAAEARDLLLRLHPYEVPCVVTLSIHQGASSPTFLAWVAEETTSVG